MVWCSVGHGAHHVWFDAFPMGNSTLTYVNEGWGFDVVVMILNRDLIPCKDVGLAACHAPSSTGKR